MTDFKCNCGAKFSVPDDAVGKKGKCPKCNQVVQIKAPTNILQGIGYGLVGLMAAFVLIGCPILILAAILSLITFYGGVYGVALIVAWLVAAIVCMCVSGIQKGFANWAGGTVGAVLWVLSCLLLSVGRWPWLVV